MAAEFWSGICNSVDFSGLFDIFHRMVWQVPNSVWLRILHFHRFDIVFLKVCRKSLIVFFLQQRFRLKACVEAFDLVQCRIEVVFQLYFWFPGQFDFISLTVVIDWVLQNIRKLFFLFCVNLLWSFWISSASILQNCWTSSSSPGSSVLFLDTWKIIFFFCWLAGCCVVAEIQFSYSLARVQPSLVFTPNGGFWLPGITCVGWVNANALTPRRAPILPSAIFGKCMWRKLLKTSHNWLSSTIFAAATFRDGVLNVRESSNDISVDLYGVIVTGSTIFERDMLFSVLRNCSGTECRVSRGSS